MFIQRFVLVLAAVVAAAPFPVEGRQVRRSVVLTNAMVPEIAPEVSAQVINAGARNVIPDHYIVLFKPGTTRPQVRDLETKVEKLDGNILLRYGSRAMFLRRRAVLGFAAYLGPRALEIVFANQHVDSVEADQKMSSSSVTEPTLSRGLDRIDQRLLPLNRAFQYTETGEGVHAYVLDSGIRTSHQEFEGRASSDFSAFVDSPVCAGHGTHVAGTLGGKTYGVARKVWLHSVRVMDCNEQGNLSDVIAGVKWITENRKLPAVANMSISGETEMPALEVVVQESIDSGVTYVVAAHNRGTDACNYSPAHIHDAITVGAVNPQTDVLWVMSNHGTCVDLFAPGVAILSAGIADDEAKAVRAGTSMATAYVAGVAALVLQLNPRATPSEVWNKIHDNNNVFPITTGWKGIMNLQDPNTPKAALPNELLHWGSLNNGHDDGDTPATTNDAPSDMQLRDTRTMDNVHVNRTRATTMRKE